MRSLLCPVIFFVLLLQGCLQEPKPFEVELSSVTLGIDTSQPVIVNHRIPISFTLIGKGDEDEAQDVAISFRFEEQNPVEGNEAIVCRSNSILVSVAGNNSQVTVDNGFIWPVTECLEIAATTGTAQIAVDFLLGEEALDATVSANLPSLELRNGGVDVAYALESESSVGLLPLTENNSAKPVVLAVQSSLVYNGADPYYTVVEEDEIPESLTEAEPNIEEELTFGFDAETLANFSVLPSSSTLRYHLIPASNPATELALTIRQDDGTTQSQYEFESLEVGIPDNVSHDLVAEGSTLTALKSGGDFAEETQFTLVGCVFANFQQDGNGLSDTNDCQQKTILLVRETAEAADNTELSFNKSLRRNPGNSRIRLTSLLSTNNELTRRDINSASQAKVELSGKIGRSFSLTLAHAQATASLSPTEAAYNVSLSAFNNTLFSDGDEHSATFTSNHDVSFDKTRTLGNLGFGFGPIRFGFSISAGGRVGLTSEDELSIISDDDECKSLLNTNETTLGCSKMSRAITPETSLSGKVFGGLSLRIVKVGVQANLRFAEATAPLVSTLAFGRTSAQNLIATGNVDWATTMQLIRGKVKLVGSIKFLFFRKSMSIQLFSFSSKKHSIQHIDRTKTVTVSLVQ